MKDSENLHQKVQELCDCYTTTDPLKEMSEVSNETDLGQAAMKWLALSVLHGVNNNAKKITIRETKDGGVSVTAEYRETELPNPGRDVASAVFETVRAITHIDEKKGKTQLALGFRDSSLDLDISIKEKTDKKKVSIKFP